MNGDSVSVVTLAAFKALQERVRELERLGAGARWLDVDGLSEHFGWTKKRVYHLTAEGRIPRHKIEGRLMFDWPK